MRLDIATNLLEDRISILRRDGTEARVSLKMMKKHGQWRARIVVGSAVLAEGISVSLAGAISALVNDMDKPR